MEDRAPGSARHSRVRVAIVAPSMRILGGQAVQADRLLAAWRDDPDVAAWLVPINPLPPRWAGALLRVRYVRTIVTQLLYWPLLLRELRKADVVHVFSASYFSFLLAPLPAVLVAKLLRRPVLVNYRSGQAPDHLRRSAIARATLRRVDRILVPSRFLRDVFASFGMTAHVVPNIVDVARFAFRRRDRAAPKLLSTRNFESLYNVACTLRAFRLVQDEHPEAALTLVGAGSLDGSLRQLAEDLALRNVTFVGAVAPADIWRCYADADIYVQTPDIDNMPSSILEAFSSGTPVVSTNAGGVPAIVTDGEDGLLAPVGDHQAVARHILRLLGDPGLAARLAAAARSQCEQYTWARVREQWIAIYEELARPTSQSAEATSQAPGSRDRRALTRRSPLARLRAMDRHEVRFRTRSMARGALHRLAAIAGANRWRRGDLVQRLDASDAALQAVRDRLATSDWSGAHQELGRHFRARPARFVLDPNSRAALAAAVITRFPAAEDDATRRADRILAGRYDLLGYTDLRFANGALDPDWKLDPVHGRRAADAWWSRVRYLDPSNGDHKIIWELNRQQHWLTLGRAYWLTGREEYRGRFVAELESWLAENRPLVGINWTSMLELGFRGLSWLWALHFFVGSESEDQNEAETPHEDEAPWLVDLLLGLDRQMRHVEENLSYYFSPNTHLTGEALALYVVGRALPELAGSRRWEALGRGVLIEEAQRQILPDGGHAERSAHYHRYTLDFYSLALAVAQKTGDEIAERALEPVVARLARFAAALADANGCLPHIGDDDAGTLLPLCGSSADDVRPSLSLATALLGAPVPADELAEHSLWLGVRSASGHFFPPGGVRSASEHFFPRGGVRSETAHFFPPDPAAIPDRSAVFPATGYYVSRTRTGDHLVFDAGRHGFLNGGHAHADALSLTLSLRWHRFLIDAGTGTYTTDLALRDRFRSTAMHNTLVLDGRSQSQPDGPFHWASTADGREIRSALNPRFDFFEAAHDGYLPVTHRRAVFAAAGDLWLIVDHVLGDGTHTAETHWHLDPDWDVNIDGPAIEALHADGLRALLATTARRLDVFRGDVATGLGFCSPAYGRVVSCPAIRFTRSGPAPFSIGTLVLPSHDAGCVSMNAVPVTATPPGGYGFAVRIARPAGVDLAFFGVRSEGERSFPPDTGATREELTTCRPDPAEREELTSCRPDPAGREKVTSCRPDPAGRFGGFETDARFACVRLSPTGDVRAVSLVDGRVLQRPDDRPFRLELDRPAHDLAIVLDDSGALEIFAGAPLPTLAVDVPARPINRVLINDVRVSFRRSGTAVIVPAEPGGSGREGRAAAAEAGSRGTAGDHVPADELPAPAVRTE